MNKSISSLILASTILNLSACEYFKTDVDSSQDQEPVEVALLNPLVSFHFNAFCSQDFAFVNSIDLVDSVVYEHQEADLYYATIHNKLYRDPVRISLTFRKEKDDEFGFSPYFRINSWSMDKTLTDYGKQLIHE